MEEYKISLLVILIALTLFLTYTIAYGAGTVVYIDEGGIVEVQIVLPLSRGVHEVRAPVEPIASTATALADGTPIPLVYDNGSFYLVLNNDANVNITYIANVSLIQNVFYLAIDTEDVADVRIHKDVILLSWPEERIVNARVEQDKLVLSITGSTIIRYTLRLPAIITISSPLTSSPTIPTSPPLVSQPATSPTSPYPTATEHTSKAGQPPISANLAVVAVAVVVLAAGIGVGYYMYTSRVKKNVSNVSEMLNDIDIAIIRVLESKGGSVLQTELQNDINVPRTTLWRHVRKLEKLGLVKVEKVGLQNRITLIKKVKI